MREHLRVGVIGAGWVAVSRHIPAFRRDSRTRVVAVMDPHLEHAEAVARRFGILGYYADIEEMLTKCRLDIVSVCTPPWAHCANAVAAMMRDCHVLVEKPMAMSLPECDVMISTASQKDRHLCVAHNFLFSHSMRQARLLAQSGALGRIIHVVAVQLSSPQRRLPRWYPRLPGGLFYDEVPHMLYLLQDFIGPLNLVGVNAEKDITQQHLLKRLDVYFETAIATAHLKMVFNSPVSEWLLTVIGERQILVVDVFRDILLVLPSDNGHRARDILKTSLLAVSQHLVGVLRSGARFFYGSLLYGHDILVNRFVTSVIEGSEVPVNPKDARDIVRLMHEILARAYSDARS